MCLDIGREEGRLELRGRVPGQHISEELGSLVGWQSSKPAHHISIRLGLGKLAWETHRDCRLFRKGGIGTCGREDG